MTHMRMAPVMGLMMGAMIPLMIHGGMGDLGAAFVLVHVAVLAAGLSLALVLPKARTFLQTHRPSAAMGLRMGLGAVGGFAVVCSHCLLTWHGAA